MPCFEQTVASYSDTILIQYIIIKIVRYEVGTNVILSGFLNGIYCSIGVFFMRLFLITEPDIRKGTLFKVVYSEYGRLKAKRIILHSTNRKGIQRYKDAIISGNTNWLSVK
jgi:hypothetical protein